MSEIKLSFWVVAEPGEADAFLGELYELANDAEVSFSNIKMVSDGTRVEFISSPEHLTDKIADVINHAAHMFNAGVTEPKEV